MRFVTSFIAWILRGPYVWIKSNEDHKVYLTRVQVTPFGATVENKRTGGRTLLVSDGTVKLGSYDTGKWLPANKAAKKLILSRGES